METINQTNKQNEGDAPLTASATDKGYANLTLQRDIFQDGSNITTDYNREIDADSMDIGESQSQLGVKHQKETLTKRKTNETYYLTEAERRRNTIRPRLDRNDDKNIKELLEQIKITTTKMQDSTLIQRNISMTIKNGIKEILEIVDIALHKTDMEIQTSNKEGNKTDGTQNENDVNGEETKKKRKREVHKSSRDNTPQKKRTEPVESEIWQTVRSKNKITKEKTETDRQMENSRATPKTKGTAVIIKPLNDKTYSDIVKQIRTDVDPKKDNVQVTTMRRTRDGALLLKLKTNLEGRKSFQESIQKAVGNDGHVKDLTNKTTLEIMDLTCVDSVEDVTKALRQETGRIGDFKIHIFGPNGADQYMAACELESHEAAVLLRRGRIKIGWLSCRVRKRLSVTRCFKCLAYGHNKVECTGIDRTDCCNKCGNRGHYRRECKTEPNCFICREKGNANMQHAPGTGACPAFRAALDTAKQKAGR